MQSGRKMSTRAMSKRANGAASVKVESTMAQPKAKRAKPTPAAEQAGDAIAATEKLSDMKWKDWSPYQTASPFPDFLDPTAEECKAAHGILKRLHQADVDKEFSDENTPDQSQWYWTRSSSPLTARQRAGVTQSAR